jgi:hypothetical protein
MARIEPLPFGHAVLDETSPWRRPPVPEKNLRVRVPAELKRGVEEAAARAGVPADLWLIETIGRSIGSARA